MALETGLEGKPWWISAVVAVVLASLMIFGLHYAKLKTIKDQITSRQESLADLQRKINEGRTAQSNLPQFREEVRRNRLELERLLRILPARRNIEDLIGRFRALFEQGGFDLRRMTPSNPYPIDFYSEWPIKLQVNGTYHNLALFFDRVSRIARIINVEKMLIRGLGTQGSRDRTISADFTVKTYIYNPPVEEETP